MASRYTDTNKWNDAWFAQLKPMDKLLWHYVCDNCDIAGFIEYIPNKWANDIGTDIATIENSIKGLSRGLLGSKDGLVYYIKNFLKHQKNLPINIKNNAHLGILKRFENYAHYFDIQDVNDFITNSKLAPSKPLDRGYGNGKGKGNGNGNGNTAKKNFNFKQMKSYFLGIDYELQTDELKLKYSKQVYDAYCKFLSEFEKYEEGLHDNPFIGLEFFSKNIYKKFSDSELGMGVTKMFGLGIRENTVLTARFLDVLGMVKPFGNGKVKNEDGTGTNKNHEAMRETYNKPQAFG